MPTLPSSPQAEAALLGSLLLDGAGMSSLAPMLQGEDFVLERDRWVFDACQNLFQRQEVIDQVTVTHELSRLGRLEGVGGPAYLMELVAQAPIPFEAKPYGDIVLRCSRARQLIAAAGQISLMGYEESAEGITKTISRAKRLLDKVVGRDWDGTGKPSDLADAVGEWLRPPQEKPLHLPWGRVERLTGSLQRGQTWLIGAKTTIGKTTALLNVALSVAQAGQVVLYLTQEELREQVGLRLSAMLTGVDIGAVLRGELDPIVEGKLVAAQGILAGLSLWTPRMRGISDVERWITTVEAEAERLDLVLVDYFQLLLQGKENRYEEATFLSQRLKALAQEHHVPIVVASQFSREASRRGSGRPILSDLKESGSLENDADVVVFLHRLIKEAFGGAEHPKGAPAEGDFTEFIVAKNRFLGRLGTVKLAWNPELRSYEEAPEEM